MKKKQMYGLIVAGVVFICVCTASMLVKSFFGGIYKDFSGSTGTSEKVHTSKYIPVLKIEGTIDESSEESGLIGTSGYNHKKILERIQEYQDDSQNKGILLYIDSTGGSVYASDEVYLRLMKYKKETKRPIWAYMGSYACSGAYYIAMAADKIIANRNATTGSIGVTMETMNCQDLLKKLGVEVDYITSGANKAMGREGKKLTKEQRKIFQNEVNESYEQFLDVVNEGRKDLNKETIKKLADGRTYTAKQALSHKLIDDIKSYEDAKDSMRKEVGSAIDIEEEEDETSIMDILKTVAVKKEKKSSDSETKELLEYIKNRKSGGVYYEMPR